MDAIIDTMEHGRYVFFDTETTGLKAAEGHRIIEIGAVEVIDRQLTGNNFQLIVNPERASEAKALETHGHTEEFLADKPLLESKLDEVIAYFGNAVLVAHNAPFDIGFLDAEFNRLRPDEPRASIRWQFIDTLKVAQQIHPGQSNSLDNLCKRYRVDLSERVKHGALIDSKLLAEVYIAMTSVQMSVLGEEKKQSAAAGQAIDNAFHSIPATVLANTVTTPDTSLAAHDAFLSKMFDKNAPFGNW